MTNNQLAENSVIQLLNSVKLARDNAERADNRVDHSFYYALTIALEELQERRKADSEPVAYISKSDFDAGYPHILARRDFNKACTMAVYAAQPAPIVEREPIAWLNDAYLARGVVDGEAGSEDAGPGYIPVYRHAQPAPVVPENCVTAEHRRVIEMLLNVCGAAFDLADDSCQQDVDGEDCHVVPDDAFQKLSDALDEIENTLPTEDTDRPDVFLVWSAMPRAALKSILQAGNSPVIPDGWTCNDKANAALMMLDRIETVDPVDDDRIDGIKRIVRELAAATQPQNAPQNIPEIIPGWIPVSERMPPSRHEVLVGRWWGEKPRWCCKWATYIPGHPDSQSSGWLIPGASWTPTHWMPLPVAPQEVSDAEG